MLLLYSSLIVVPFDLEKVICNAVIQGFARLNVPERDAEKKWDHSILYDLSLRNRLNIFGRLINFAKL